MVLQMGGWVWTDGARRKCSAGGAPAAPMRRAACVPPGRLLGEPHHAWLYGGVLCIALHGGLLYRGPLCIRCGWCCHVCCTCKQVPLPLPLSGLTGWLTSTSCSWRVLLDSSSLSIGACAPRAARWMAVLHVHIRYAKCRYICSVSCACRRQNAVSRSAATWRGELMHAVTAARARA